MDAGLCEVAWLARNGVPWHTALAMAEDERMALTIIFGTFEGGRFNWDRLEWEERK